ncbi:hypothetical protein [Paenibacillus sp. KN14-4R]|uniref:hypothetical protein n=1 Tax=Paenibacillus sp. KN14-4R TaxID=3445773 RepID=UPI003FA0115A
MNKVWIEYQIMPEYREGYMHFIQKRQKEYKQMELFEGTDQMGLFVEQWNEMDYEAYLQLKARRRNMEDEEWAALAGFIKGGIHKINIWHFTQIKYSQ